MACKNPIRSSSQRPRFRPKPRCEGLPSTKLPRPPLLGYIHRSTPNHISRYPPQPQSPFYPHPEHNESSQHTTTSHQMQRCKQTSYPPHRCFETHCRPQPPKPAPHDPMHRSWWVSPRLKPIQYPNKSFQPHED